MRRTARSFCQIHRDRHEPTDDPRLADAHELIDSVNTMVGTVLRQYARSFVNGTGGPAFDDADDPVVFIMDAGGFTLQRWSHLLEKYREREEAT